MKYSMTCTCGHEMSVEAENREEAVMKMQEMMTPEAIAAHWSEKHMGEDMQPSKEEMDAMIEEKLMEVAE